MNGAQLTCLFQEAPQRIYSTALQYLVKLNHSLGNNSSRSDRCVWEVMCARPRELSMSFLGNGMRIVCRQRVGCFLRLSILDGEENVDG